MVLSLLCEREDKIFISYCFVSTLEKWFCIFFFLQCRGTKFPAEFAWIFFSVHLRMCPYANVYCVTCRAGDKRIHREKNKGKRPGRYEDRGGQTDLSHVPLLSGPSSRCHQNSFYLLMSCFKSPLKSADRLFLKSLSGSTQDTLVWSELESIWKRNHFTSD